jgi:hypothetical protein
LLVDKMDFTVRKNDYAILVRFKVDIILRSGPLYVVTDIRPNCGSFAGSIIVQDRGFISFQEMRCNNICELDGYAVLLFWRAQGAVDHRRGAGGS